MTATGLVVIGRVVHEINKRYDDPLSREEYYRRLATEIDWKRSAAVWKNAIVQNNKVMTQRGPVREAASRVDGKVGACNSK